MTGFGVKIMRKPRIVLLALALACETAAAGLKPSPALQVGVEAGFGTVVNRIGICLDASCVAGSVQANLRIAGHWDASGFGPPLSRFELHTAAGLVCAFGRRASRSDPFPSVVWNRTRFENSVGYAYGVYWDSIATTQATGSLSLQFGKTRILTENDALAFGSRDRYRTGAIEVSYRDADMAAGLETVIWTGDPRGAKRVEDPGYPSRYGYKDLSDRHYGSYSHGILALTFRKKVPGLVSAVVKAGIDSEQVRFVVQDRFHDLISFPADWNRSKTPHYPMLTPDGTPFLFQPGQSIRPARFFFFCGVGSPGFY